MKLALMDCGRKLGTYLRKRAKMRRAGERRDIFRRYIGEVAKACEALSGADAKEIYEALLATAKTKTIESDQVLDEEGKVVAVKGDETVYIRETDDDAPAENGAPATKKRPAASSGDTLFGDDDEALGIESADATPKRKIKKKVAKKKVVRKKKGG